MFEPSTVDVNGVPVRVWTCGSGAPLLFLHGAGSRGDYTPHLDRLADHFRVIAPDHPGWGDTPHSEWMTEMLDYVYYLDGLISALALERPIVVGHSLGGWMASLFAATYPNRARALILVNSAGYPFAAEDSVPDFFAVAARGGPEFARMLFHQPEAAKRFFPVERTAESSMKAFRDLTSTARLTWHNWFDDKLPYRLARIESPTLVLWGKEEKLFPVDMGKGFANGITCAKLLVLENCGHMLPVEAPDEMVQAITNFVTELGE